MVTSVPVLAEFGRRLTGLGWISNLFVAGSLATGDYVPGVSDLDLVALVDGPVDTHRQATLTAMHRHLDGGTGSGRDLGCVYVEAETLPDVRMKLARHLLEASDLPVDQIARRAGFGTAASLRQHLHAAIGVSPLTYRRTFHAADVQLGPQRTQHATTLPS